MKRLNKILNNRYSWWALLFLALIVLFIPALGIKFSWIDDGQDILVSRQIVNSIRSFDFKGLGIILSEGNGRLRIIYWFYQALEYLVGGTNPLIHFAVHFSVIFITSIFIFEIVKSFTKSNFAGFFSGLIYLLSPINTENIYRLGPQEPLLCIFVAASLYFLFRKKLFLSILFLFLSTFSKEPGFVLFLPILLAYLLKRIFYKNRDIQLEKYLILGFIFLLPIFFNVFLRRSGYSTNYEFAISGIVKNLSSYLDLLLKGFAPFFGFFLFTYFIRLAWFFKKNRTRKKGLHFIEQGVFVLIFFAFVVIQSPWKYVLQRYLMPASVGLVIFLGIELMEVRKLLSGNLKTIRLLSIIFIGYFVVATAGNIVRVYILGERVAFETNSIQSMISYIAENSPKNGKVLFNFITGDSTIELVSTPKLLMSILYNRSDVATGYLNINKIDPGTTFIVGRLGIRATYTEEEIESQTNFSSKIVLLSEKIFPVITTPDNLIKQIIKKTLRRIVYKEPFNLDGIYTQYRAVNRWYIYRLSTY